jgi:hypothetical protein
MWIREPVAAGYFYDSSKDSLTKQIENIFKHKFAPKKKEEKEFHVCIVPHAGYAYSGSVAAHVYAKIKEGNYIIIGPNHYGFGSTFALMKKGLWKTPLGLINIDENLANKILEECNFVEYDVIPLEKEHSIEVQLPFLQYRFGSDFKFVPISILNEVASDTFLENCRLLGKALAKIVEKEKLTIIATSDFSHYVPHELAKKIDRYLIKSIVKMDEKEFFDRVNEKKASACGFGPIAVAISVAKGLKCKKGELLSYRTSGDITSDYSSVVGYASIIFS